MHAPVFCGRQSTLIELHQSGVIAWRQRRRSCYVFKSCISVAHCPFQRKWRVIHNNGIYPFVNGSVCLLMGSPTWWKFSFCLSWSSLVLLWRDAPLVREFQIWGHRCKKWDSHWFQGCKCVSVKFGQPCLKTFHDIFSSTNLYNSYFIRLLMHAVYSCCLLSLPVAHSRQPVALKWDGESLSLVSTVFQENICTEKLHFKCIYLKEIKIIDAKIQYNTHFIDKCVFGL